VSKTVIVTIIIAGLFVVFVTDFGLLELIGALIEPLMRPVFKVPGYASIDAVTSFVANPTLGIFLTNRLYKEKMYTTREAASIATNFSFISLGFFAVLVESAGILDHYGDVVLWSFILGLAEVALPSAFISGLGVAPAAAFFVVTVTALQIIMFSNSAVSIMESDIPLNAGKLVIIFFLRTLIAMPLVAIVTHIIF
jgi:nucleoside recognition membrane protein YjiH